MAGREFRGLRVRGGIGDARKQGRGSVAFPVGVADEEFIRDEREGPDVRSGGDLVVAGELLGGHVERRSDATAPGGGAVGGDASDAEIEHLHSRRTITGEAQKQICGLQVAVHDAVRVHLVEGRGDLLEEVCRERGRHRGALRQRVGDEAREVFAVQQLHHDERRVRGLVHVAVEHGDDVIAVDACACAGLAEEALNARQFASNVRAQYLHRDPSAGHCVLGLEDLRGAAGSDALHESIAL